MNLCEDKHKEVCFEGKTCPVCDLKEELQAVIDEQKETISTLESELDAAAN